MRSVVWTLIVKYLLVALLASLVLPAVGQVNWPQAIWVAALYTGIAYIVGDRLTLPVAGNAGAVVADFVMAVGIFWLVPVLAPGARIGFGGALTAGGAVAVGEIVYHQYLLRRGVGQP